MVYNSKSIQILEGLEAVRKRPGMYIGSTNSTGLHHLLWEIVDNSIDEALALHCNEINVIINNDKSISVEDNGRGIPIDIHPKTNKTAVETVFTILHAGGKFNSDTYKVSGGLHGVGSSVVNALSSWLVVEIYKNNKIHKIEFENGGKTKKELEIIGNTKKTGTKVTFLPDWKIFDENLDFSLSIIKDRFKQSAFLNKKLKLTLKDKRISNNNFFEFYYENGIKDYLNEILLEEIKTNDAKKASGVFYGDFNWNNINFQIGFQYTTITQNQIFSFCNNIFTPSGGTHLEGVKQSMIRCFNNWFKIKKKNIKLIWDDIQEGLNLIISIQHPDPQYEGQTKSKLSNSNVQKNVLLNFPEILRMYLLENPNNTKNIFDKLTISYKGRMAAKKAKEITIRKTLDESFSLPGKLSDCELKNPNETEIYIVEGDSAGGSAKLGRDRKFQAILPIRGKLLNVEKAVKNKVFANNEIKTIITALGTEILSKFNIRALRYKKIIIMTDADVDGSHIRILLLTFFYKFMRPLIEEGNIYIAQPPLFKIKYNNKVKYLYSDDELNNLKKELIKNNNKYRLQRYKGLGEMNPDQLWETTMNPKNRFLLKVLINNAFEASEIFTKLMGNDIQGRKQFINENAQFVKNLDI